MGIICNKKDCPIEQTKENLHIPQFSRSDVYFQNLSTDKDSVFIHMVNNDIEKSNSYFQQADWKTHVTDTTKQEASWSGTNTRVIYSKNIEANNYIFGCTHGVTVWKRANVFQKRQLIDCWVNIK